MNAIRCLNCGEVVRSRHRHDYRSCRCEGEMTVSVDGGEDYIRRGFGSKSRWVEVHEDGSESSPHSSNYDPAAEAQQYARRLNPRTSHDAALKMVESGRVANQRQRILDDLTIHDGATAAEMEGRTGVRCHRRMAALERDGLVKRGLPRTCEATGMKATTWWKTTHPAGGWRER